MPDEAESGEGMGSELVRIDRQAVAVSSPVVPVLVAAAGTDATMRFLDFFATQIENDNTRAAYLRAARGFLAWCEGRKIALLTDIQPVHVAAWMKQSKLYAFGADGEASPRCDPSSLRLAGDRSRHADQSRGGCARAEACGAQGQNPGPRCG
jgi:hypothetical protein